MGLLDLLLWIREGFGPDENEHPDPETLEPMAGEAESDTVRAGILAGVGDKTKLPVVEYLEDDEQPHYMLRAGEVVAVDEGDNVARKYPGLETVVVATDRRLLVVLGGHVADELIEVPLKDIVDVDVELERYRTYLTVAADREGEPMTFSIDVTLEADDEAVWDTAAFLRPAGAGA